MGKLNIIKSLKENQIVSYIIQIAEVALDSKTNNELLKSIPVLKQIVDGLNLYDSIRDRFLINKLGVFFNELDSISWTERTKFVDKLTNESNLERLCEQIIIYLDRCDSLEKAEIMTKLFKAFVIEEINFNDFARCCSALDRITIIDLKYLKTMYYKLKDTNWGSKGHIYLLGQQHDYFVSSNLVLPLTGLGLNQSDIDLSIFDLEDTNSLYPEFYITELGIEIIKYGMSE